MNRLPTLLISTLFGAAMLYAGCAGQLTDEEKDQLLRDIDGGLTGGSGGAGGGTGGVGTGGATGGTGGVTGGAGGATGGAAGATGGAAGAGGGMLDPCMAPLMKEKCSLAGCHGGTVVVAGLDLGPAILAAPQPLVDKLNRGETGACMPSVGKIIDSQRPDQSLLYTKVTTPTCGTRMPPSGPMPAAETSCILNWIRSIPGVAGGTGGAGGAAGAGGGAGSAGAGGARDGGRG